MGTLPFDGAEEYGRRAEPSARRGSARSGAAQDRSAGWLAAWWRAILIAAVLLVALGGAAWGVWQFLLNHPRFFLASVELHGRKYAAASQIEDRFVADRGRSIFRLPLGERRRGIEQIPWVRSAAVTRVFPNKISVAIEERVPVAFLDTPDGIDLIDAEGMILETPPQALFTFPVVRGITAAEPAASRREKMQLLMALFEDLDRGDKHLREEISEVDLSDSEDARAVLADSAGAVVLHLGHQDFLARYLLYASHVAQWKRKFANLQSVDLRFDGQAVINADPPRAPPSPVGGAPTKAAGAPVKTENRSPKILATTAAPLPAAEPAANPNAPPAAP